MTERVFILGAGRAGRGLARALRASGADVVGVHGRHAESGDELVTTGPLPPALESATVVIVTVRDEQLEEALRQLTEADLDESAIVLHASGANSPVGLDALRRAGHPCGTFHPLVPLADPAHADERLRGAWIGVDGDEPAIDAARRLAGRLGARTLRIPEAEKARYHAAAVFAANFPTVLAAIAARLLRDAGVADAEGQEAVLGLMRAAVENLQHRDPARALTGPIARGDVGTIERHLAALAGDEGALAAYRVLSAVAIDLAREGGADGERLRRILDALATAGE